jgi:Icc-related predicted phosphoesterase
MLSEPHMTAMHVLALSDIHAAYSRMERIISRETGWEVLVIGGDLTTRGTEKEALEVIKHLKQYGRPILAVAGNMDPPSFDELFERENVGLNGRGVTIGEVGFFGVSGSPPTPMHTPYEISESLIAERARLGYQQILSARVKVFIPHAPPAKTSVDRILLGRHVGSSAVREFIEHQKPDLVICGHIHEARGIDRIGPTQIVNCAAALNGSYALITIGDSVHVELKG